MTHVGFTGTRHSLTLFQKSMVDNLLRYHLSLGWTDFHHGDCVGGDDYTARVAYAMGYRVHCHPPINTALRAYAPYHVAYEPLPYLDRNLVIVASSCVGLAAPNGETPRSRSGTWSTINKFHTTKLPYWVIAPQRCWCNTSFNRSLSSA